MNVSLLPQSLDEPREDGVLRKGAGEQDLPFTYSGTNVTQESVGTLIAIQRNLPDEVGGWLRSFDVSRHDGASPQLLSHMHNSFTCTTAASRSGQDCKMTTSWFVWTGF